MKLNYHPRLKFILLLLSATFFLSCQTGNEADRPPNIILILGDDIGYSDIAPYGSEIETPNLQRLADEGIRFTHFYNMAKCEPTRSSLFTGRYEGGADAVNFARLLREQGYYTIHSGKQHFLKWVPDQVRAENVFHRSITFRAMNEFFEPPSGKFHTPFILNGKEVNISELDYEKRPFFKTDALTDQALKWLEEPLQKGQPFFLFMGYGAAHYPLQARPEDIAKYRGKYKKGWDIIREERLARLKKSGILPENTRLSPPSSNINRFRGHPKGDEAIRANIPRYRPWSTLTPQEQDALDLEMAVFAAMVDCMDQNIGRLLARIDQAGVAGHTIVIFLSDNGSCPYDSNRNFDFPPGDARGFRTLSAAWANAGNTPFRYFKQFGHEGGANTHCLVRWPDKIAAGTITRQTAHVVDLFHTLMEAVGITYPTPAKKETQQVLHGSSLMPVFEGEKREEPPFYISGWKENFRMFRQGDWKLVRLNHGAWELYHMIDDPTETNNLADKMPEKLNQMIESYKAESKKVGYPILNIQK